MTVSNGQLSNQTTYNDAFVSRTADDNTVGKKDLQNTDTASGPDVINVQREVNSLNSYTGRPSGSAHDADPSWTSTDVGTGTDTLKDRAEALSETFNETTGHTHDGTAGNGGPISAQDLSDLNYFRALRVTDTVQSGTGSSVVVTSAFLGKTAGGNSTTAGVATTAGINRVWIANGTDETAIVDPGGQVVYGLLTEAAGVWTLSFYTNEAGVETAYTFPSDTPLRYYYTEVFTLDAVPTFAADAGYIQSLDFTADIVDASQTQRGVVSTGTQSFGGNKTFEENVRLRGAVYLQEANNAQSGSTVTLTNDSVGVVRVTNASLVSIAGMAAPSFNQVVEIFNATGINLIIENDNASTAIDGILTGTGANFDFLTDASVLITYDVTTQRWRMVGGGGGGGSGISTEIQYVTNGGGESDIAGYSTYADGAATPVDGTGGSPTATWTRTTSSPLIGTASFLFTPGTLGDGASYDFTIDAALQAQVLEGTFYYQITTPASYTKGDITLWIYDVTNAQLIQPSVYQLDNVIGTAQHRFEFQTASNSTSYRLLVHQATSATGYASVKMDAISVSPSKVVNGSITTEWKSYTPTIVGFGTPASVSFEYRQNGDSIDVRGKFTSGTPTATEARFGLPSGFVIDSAKLSSIKICGAIGTSGVLNNYHALMVEPSVAYLTVGLQSVAGGVFAKRNGSALVAASDVVSVNASGLPIVGLGATAILGQDADTRVVGFSANGATATVTGTASNVSWVNISKDSHGGFDGVDDYVVPVSGWYDIYSQLRIDGTYSVNQVATITIRKNGITVAVGQDRAGGAVTSLIPNVKLNDYFLAGDSIRILVDSGATTPSISATAAFNLFSVQKASGPSQVAASEHVSCKYDTSVTAATSGATIVYTNKVWDTHSAFNNSTGIFTCPTPGKYTVRAGFIGGSHAAAATDSVTLNLNKNGTNAYIMQRMQWQASVSLVAMVYGSAAHLCNAGDTLRVTVSNSFGGTINGSGTSSGNYIEIIKED